MTLRKYKGSQKEQDERTLRLIRGRCDEIGECWIWTGATGGRSSLPCMHREGKTQYVRRVVYELSHDRPAGRLVVTPKCTNPACVSPRCLEAIPRKLALQRAGQRGAYSSPSKLLLSALAQRARSRYSDELIEQIKASEAGHKQVSRETGMSVSYVRAIRRGEARRDLRNPFAGLLAANDSQRWI